MLHGARAGKKSLVQGTFGKGCLPALGAVRRVSSHAHATSIGTHSLIMPALALERNAAWCQGRKQALCPRDFWKGLSACLRSGETRLKSRACNEHWHTLSNDACAGSRA